MSVTVTSEAHQPEPEAEPVIEASGPQSPLALIRAKRGELEKPLFKDLAVPRVDELLGRRIWVRYRPAKPSLLTTAAEARKKRHDKAVASGQAGDPLWQEKAFADVLVDACIAVYDLALDESPPKGELPSDVDFPTFSTPELSAAYGAAPRAVDTVMALYQVPGDVTVACSQLIDWSAQASPEADSDFLRS